MTHRRTWQKFETIVPRFFGVERTGPMQSKNANDIDHPHLHVQCKYATRHAIVTVWDDAQCASAGKIPVVAVKQKGRHGFWLLIHSADLAAVAHQRELAKWDVVDTK